MMIRDAIRSQGETLFRIRGYVPLLLVPAAIFALRDSNWLELTYGDRVDDAFDWLCFAIGLSGVALRAATVGFLIRRTSGRNTRKGQVAEELNTTGLYSVMRHPLYVANTIILAGILLATGSLWLTALGLLAACLHYERVTCAEEEFLLQRFGIRFRRWVERTPAFVPRPSLWVAPLRPYSFRVALKREYQTGFALVFAFAVLDYAEDALASGRVELELETTVLFLCASVAFLVVRVLHKQTRVLRVEGR